MKFTIRVLCLFAFILSLSLMPMSSTLAQDDGASMPIYNAANGNYYQAVAGSLTWSQANEAANAMSYEGCPGHLVTITSQAETDFLVANGMGLAFEWLGAYQSADGAEPDGGWMWVTGEPFTYTNWAPSEPSNDAFGDDEDVLQMMSLGDANPLGQWNDSIDSDSPDYQYALNGYIVEYDCLVSFEGHHYQAVDGEYTWSQANAYANGMTYAGCPGHLATVTSQGETDFLVANNMGEAYWLGGYQSADGAEPDGGWMWVTGEAWDYQNWAPGEPTNGNVGAEEDVLHMAYSFQGTFQGVDLNWTVAPGLWFDNIDSDSPDYLKALNGFIVEFDCAMPEPMAQLCSPDGGANFEHEVVNNTDGTLYWIWMTFDCQERLPGTEIAPNSSILEMTSEGHIFVVRNSAGNLVGQPYTASPSQTVVTIDPQ